MKTWKAFVVLIVLGIVSQNFAMARDRANPFGAVCDNRTPRHCTYPSDRYSPPPLPPRESRLPPPPPRLIPPPRNTQPRPGYTPPRTPPPSPGCIRSRDNC